MMMEEREINFHFEASHFERSRCPRFTAALPVEYWRISNPKSGPGHSINIGEGGLMVSFPEQIEISEKLKSHFSLGRGMGFFILEQDRYVV